MSRRVICLCLSALLLLALFPTVSPNASAETVLKTSEACIEILKEMEGFISKPMYDNGQYSVGYGSGCNKNDYPNGITEEEADALLRKYLANMEKSLDYFVNRYGLTLTQNQYDALMLFTYNCGANWVSGDGNFRQAVINGTKGNDFIYAICLWSNASGKLDTNLVKRRLKEADMYLNGSYTNERPYNYTYVVYDTNGGVSDVKVQGYDSNATAEPKSIPVLSGYRFMGWYTAKEGGSWVNVLDASTDEKTLYAHWQQGSGDAVNGTAASYQRSANQLTTLDIYAAPGSAEVTGTVSESAKVTIVADYVDGTNVKWGKLKEGGWVNLGNSLVGIVTSQTQQDPVTVMVTNSYVNVRSGPGTSYAKVGVANIGQQLQITAAKLVGSDLWGKFSGGWISLMYTDYESALEDATADTTTVTATGTIVNCDSLRIRGGAGTNYPVVGSLACGTKVEITQQKVGSGMTWGRIASGWISLTYVSLDAVVDNTPEETVPEEAVPETTVPEETTPEVDSGENNTSSTVTGTVISSIPLNIRSAPGAYNAKVGTYAIGTKLEILEQTSLNGDAWGRTDKGWVCMQYVLLDSANGSTEGTAGTVISGTALNIRSGAGTHNSQIGTYASGTRITVYEQTTLNGEKWGRTDRGWVCMTYVKLDSSGSASSGTTTTTPETGSTETSGSSTAGTVISSTELNIRSGAGTQNSRIGSYASGSRITILEQTTVNGEKWGRTDKGWVCMTYVRLDGSSDTSGFSGTVNTNYLRIRSAAGTQNAILGFYHTGDKVEILEVSYLNGVAWGRTGKGWICLDYVNR